MGNALADHPVRQAEVATEHQQVFGGGEIRVQRVHLGHHAQAGLDGQGVPWHLLVTKIGDGAAIRFGQAQTHADGGGLARPVGADHAQAFAGLDVETQVIDHRLVAIALGQVVDR